jgi:hypothetical protein
MELQDATVGEARPGRNLRLLALFVVALALTACSTTRPPPDAARPEPSAVDPPHTDALSAPADESPATEPPVSDPPPAPPPSTEPPPEPEPATEPKPDEPAPKDEPKAEPEETGMLASTRSTLKSTTEWLARGVDSWFGDQPFEDGGEVRDGRLSIGLFKRQDEKLDFRVRFNARVRLPNLQKRAYLFIGRDNEREVVADTPGAFSRQDRLLSESREDRSFFTGLGLTLRDAFDLRLGFHGIKPYAQARYKRPWTLSERDLVEFRQTFFWRISDRFGSTSVLSYEHALAPDVAIRWLSAATITQKTEKYDWSSIVGGYKTFGQKLLSLEGVISGRVGIGVPVGEYGVQTKWLQPIYRDYVLGELQVGYFWPRFDEVSERTRRWALGFATTMRF